MPADRKSKAWSEQSVLLEPNPTPNLLVNRDEWIEHAYNSFVSSSPSNKAIYRVILQTLWPIGHGIPGPIVESTTIRRAVDEFKGKPYLDVFRRLRELQGEEGFLGIIKQGTKYQLIHTNISPKRTPRTHLSDDKWALVLNHYKNICACCGAPPEERGFQQDHKVPRLRGGTDELSNWQPLCDSCNNQKSTACRGCNKDCTKCGWAFPEFYRPITIQGPVLRMLHAYADTHNLDANTWVTEMIRNYLESH